MLPRPRPLPAARRPTVTLNDADPHHQQPAGRHAALGDVFRRLVPGQAGGPADDHVQEQIGPLRQDAEAWREGALAVGRKLSTDVAAES